MALVLGRVPERDDWTEDPGLGPVFELQLQFHFPLPSVGYGMKEVRFITRDQIVAFRSYTTSCYRREVYSWRRM
jgi:hypothetical protein